MIFTFFPAKVEKTFPRRLSLKKTNYGYEYVDFKYRLPVNFQTTLHRVNQLLQFSMETSTDNTLYAFFLSLEQAQLLGPVKHPRSREQGLLARKTGSKHERFER